MVVNLADARGGGLFNHGHLVVIQGSTLHDNQALGSGGGIRAVGVYGGRPVDGDGDGISLCDAGAFEANHLLFANGFEH